jgi:hypothetical protein
MDRKTRIALRIPRKEMVIAPSRSWSEVDRTSIGLSLEEDMSCTVAEGAWLFSVSPSAPNSTPTTWSGIERSWWVSMGASGTLSQSETQATIFLLRGQVQGFFFVGS